MKLLRTATLTCFLVLLPLYSAYAQQFESLYPYGNTAISEKPLPPKVYQAQKNILIIKARFFYKGPENQDLGSYYGSGFIEQRSGYVITARHVVSEIMAEFTFTRNEYFHIDENGIPRGDNYGYELSALVVTPTGILEYPLEIKAVGKMYTHLDAMILKPVKAIPVKGLPLSLEVKPGQKIYAGGFTNYTTHEYTRDGQVDIIRMDENIKFNFENTVLAVLENGIISKMGLKRMYRLTGRVTFGFSGGPILNTSGQVIGITNEGNPLFLYSVSSQDILELIKSVESKKITP